MQLPAADSSDDEGLEDAEEEFVGGEDSSDEEDGTADTVATYIGNAVAPTGYNSCGRVPTIRHRDGQAGFYWPDGPCWLGLESGKRLVPRHSSLSWPVHQDGHEEGAHMYGELCC